MGVSSKIFAGSNTDAVDIVGLANILQMRERTPLGYFEKNLKPVMNESGEAEDYDPNPLYFCLSYFSGRCRVTIDMYARAMADHLQRLVKDQNHTKTAFEFIKHH